MGTHDSRYERSTRANNYRYPGGLNAKSPPLQHSAPLEPTASRARSAPRAANWLPTPGSQRREGTNILQKVTATGRPGPTPAPGRRRAAAGRGRSPGADRRPHGEAGSAGAQLRAAAPRRAVPHSAGQPCLY